jgi:hypothetical protein
VIDDGPYQCPRPTVVVLEPQQAAAYRDAGVYWYGLMTGYVLTLLTVAVLCAVVNRIGRRCACSLRS